MTGPRGPGCVTVPADPSRVRATAANRPAGRIQVAGRAGTRIAVAPADPGGNRRLTRM